MADITITTQDVLPGPESDGPYVMFVNQCGLVATRSALVKLEPPAVDEAMPHVHRSAVNGSHPASGLSQ